MKKQLWIKIFLDIAFVLSVITCVWLIVMYINEIVDGYQSLEYFYNDKPMLTMIKNLIAKKILSIIILSINLIADVIIFIFLNFKDASYLTSSLFKKWKDGKAQREVEQKEKKQAKLKAEIAEKQAMLDEMKKE